MGEAMPGSNQPYRVAGNVRSEESISFGDTFALIPLQKILAFKYYSEQHPELDIDPFHPDTVDRDTRNKAMELWLEGGDNHSIAARFRNFANAHAHESISIRDEEKLEKIFVELRTEDQSIH